MIFKLLGIVKYGVNVYADEFILHSAWFKGCYKNSSGTLKKTFEFNWIDYLLQNKIPIL